MKAYRFLAALPALAIFTACSGIMPGVGILAPKTISGYQMDFSDLEGMHNYRFVDDGTYREQCTPADASKATKKTGSWKWTRKSPSQAILVLDAKDTLLLDFTTEDHANGTFGGGGQVYAFEFTKE